MSIINFAASAASTDHVSKAAHVAKETTKPKAKTIAFGTLDSVYALSKNKAACIQLEGPLVKDSHELISKFFEYRHMTIVEGECKEAGYKLQDKNFKPSSVLTKQKVEVTVWLN